MEAKDCRKVAREALTGNWGYAVALTLLFGALMIACNYIPFIGFFVWILLFTPFNYAFSQMFLEIKRGNKIDIENFFSKPFLSFGKYWGIWFKVFLRLLPSILLVWITSFAIPFIVLFIALSGRINESGILLYASFILNIVAYVIYIRVSCNYPLVQYLLLDNPTMSITEIVKKSKKMMKGNRWRYFYLQLTFIGWSILALFTCGIGFLWLIPYMSTAYAAFYDDLLEDEIEEDVGAIVY